MKGVDTVDLPAQSSIDRNNGEAGAISQSCRLWLGIVAPVEREDDDGIVSILGQDILLCVAVPGTDITVL